MQLSDPDQYRHFGAGSTNAWACGQSEIPKLWHGPGFLYGLVAKVPVVPIVPVPDGTGSTGTGTYQYR